MNISSDEESLPSYILPIEFKTGYSAYESAPLEVCFSQEYIDKLTIRHFMSPNFYIPPTLPDGTVKLVGWSVEEPTSSQLFLIDGKIPSLNDVHVFLSEQSVKFNDGYRSVILSAQGTVLTD